MNIKLVREEKARFYAYGRIDADTKGLIVHSADFVVAVMADGIDIGGFAKLYNRMLKEKYGQVAA